MNHLKAFLRFEALAALLMALTCLTEGDKLRIGGRSTEMVGRTLRRSKAPKGKSKSAVIMVTNTVDPSTSVASSKEPKTVTTIGSTSTTSTTTTTSSSTWSQTVKVIGSDGKCAEAVLKLVDCDTKAAETVFTSSASTCSTTFDLNKKKQFCITLVVGSILYNAGPINIVNTATTSTSATITITVTSNQVLLQNDTVTKSVMTSNSPGYTVTTKDTTPSTVTTIGSTSTTSTTATTSSSTWSQTVQVIGNSGQCIDAVLKLVNCDTKAAETIFTTSASTCSTKFDFSNKQQFCLTLAMGNFIYSAGPIYTVNSATIGTGSKITITVTSSQVYLKYGTSSNIIMTSSSPGLFFGTSGSAPIAVVSPPISAPIPIAVVPPMSAPITIAPPVTSAPAPGDKKVDLISNDWGN